MKAQEELKNEEVEWITLNVAEPEARKIAIAYKIQFVPTTIINGEAKLVGVTTVDQIKDEIAKYQ